MPALVHGVNFLNSKLVFGGFCAEIPVRGRRLQKYNDSTYLVLQKEMLTNGVNIYFLKHYTENLPFESCIFITRSFTLKVQTIGKKKVLLQ